MLDWTDRDEPSGSWSDAISLKRQGGRIAEGWTSWAVMRLAIARFARFQWSPATVACRAPPARLRSVGAGSIGRVDLTALLEKKGGWAPTPAAQLSGSTVTRKPYRLSCTPKCSARSWGAVATTLAPLV